MRAFIAVELPTSVQAELVALQRELRASGADVKWVEERNLHLTMRFLGEIPEDERQAVEQLLNRLARHTPVIQASLSDVGAFPASSSPRVVWVGIGQGSDALRRVATELEEGLALLRVRKADREFVAHVTLGRVRSSRQRAPLVSRLRDLTWKPPPPFWADHLTLFQSSLTGSGPVYTALARFPFSPQ